MSASKKEQRSITFYIPDDIQDDIRQEAKDNDMSASHVARKVFREYFSKKKPKK